jgi:pinin/SDK/memA/ protein conserved region
MVKIPGEDVKEFPHNKKKRSRSPSKVDFQIEKPPIHEDPSSERTRNKKILNSVLSHLQKAKEGLKKEKNVIEIQQKIDEKVTQEIKKVAKEIKTQTIEEITVKSM